MSSYITHDANEPGTPEGPRRRHLSWKALLALGIALIAVAAAGLVGVYGMPSGLFETVGSTTTEETSSQELTEEQVRAALGSLSFQGEDVSIDPDSVDVTLSDNTVWIVQTSDEDASTAIPLASKRAMALHVWARDEADAEGPVTVCWILQDSGGHVRFACTLAPGQTLDSVDTGSTSSLLSSLSGYALSDSSYQALGLVDMPKSQGDAITNADGSSLAMAPADEEAQETAAAEASATAGEASAATEEASAGEDGSQVDSQSQASSQKGAGSASGSSDAGDKDRSAPAAADSGSRSSSSGVGGNSSGTSSSASSGEPSKSSVITVTVSVNGSLGGGRTTSARVSIPSGSSAYDALVAAGYSVDARNTSYGLYVNGISGIEATSRDRMGWVYAVNGSEPNMSAAYYTLSSGDTVAWTYVSY